MKRYKLFANCIYVKGFSRSLICDLRNQCYFLVPHSLVEYIENNRVLDGEENIEIEQEYSNFLDSNNLGFWTNNEDSFPELNYDFYYPGSISNCIIDFKNLNINEFELILNQLQELGCKFLQLRFMIPISNDYLDRICKLCSDSTISSIELFVPFSKMWEDISWLVCSRSIYSKLILIVVYNSSINSIEREYDMTNKILFTRQKNIEIKHCGVVSLGYFRSNIELFSESKKHNSCLFKKVSIDCDGNIKNCPSLLKSFGNIKNTSLHDAINTPGFKKYWNINKDKIHVCKDCEFRFVCTDCRAYVDDPEDILSKPLKCGYNPYTSEWSNWIDNPLKKKAIDFYGLSEIVKQV